MTHQNLIPFLLKAKRCTYAGKGAFSPSSRPYSKDLEYREGEFYYLDSYFGGNRFSGEEVVYFQNKPVWAMNYTGRTLDSRFSGDFLKSALLKGTEELPYRGPELYREGMYTYRLKTEGCFEWFSGYETILIGDTVVYECYFHGGTIED
jgi:hypothetical protein